MAQAIITRRKGGGGVNVDLPAQVTAFTATADSTPQITLSWINPFEYWAGTLIVKKAGSAPEGVNDGEKVYKGTETTFVDTDVEYDVTYYYRAFPFNEKKQYQTAINVVSAKPVEIPDKFADATWAQIDRASTSGIIPSTWVVGSEKDITLSTDEVLTLVIVGINHDDLADGSGKAGLTLGLKNLMAATRAMNSSNTNVGSFVAMNLYKWLSVDLKAQLPEDLQAVLKTVNKKTSVGNKSSTLRTDAVEIFLFSQIEIHNANGNASANPEGELYDYFVAAENKVKYLANGSGTVKAYWMRSPAINYTDRFCVASSSALGTGGTSTATTLLGVCFGFCI